MVLSILFLFLGLLLLFAGAEALVRGSSSLAARMGVGSLVIGLTVVAFGTSTPEMVVSVGAAIAGEGGIAAGNVIGSNIANIALILGISALLCPLSTHVQIIRFDLPVLVAISVVVTVMLWDQALGRLAGAVLFGGLIVYTSHTVYMARRERTAFPHVGAATTPVRSPRGMVRDIGFIVVGLILLVAGGRLLVTGAVAVAEWVGLSEAVIGLTIVAIGTSLPELATSVLAAVRKEADLAIGNIVGSNLFNILGILGVSALVKPLANTGISGIDLGLAIALAVALLPLARSGWRLTRWEGGLLIGVYLGYLLYLLVGTG